MEGLELALKYANDCLIGKALVMKDMHVVVHPSCIKYRMENDYENILLEVNGHWVWRKTKEGAGYVQVKNVTIKQLN